MLPRKEAGSAMIGTPSRTVLVVDDEPLVRWSVGERLRDEGYDVLEAGTGRAAIEQCDDRVDLVLLDSRLPDLDGVSVLERLLNVRSDLHVILMTADPVMDDDVQGLRARPFPRAAKPFLLDDLVELVRGSLGMGVFSRGPGNLSTV
jgi:two-component system OmpR family response regulator